MNSDPNAATPLRRHLDELAAALDSVGAHEEVLERWGTDLADDLRGGRRLLAAGNGGSAAEAQHLTAELVGRFLAERMPLSAICLSSETSSLTAILNDYGADEVFARQVEAHGRPGDVLVLLSTSGRSPNLLHAARRGREQGLTVWALTGPAPNPLADLADEAVCVEAPSTSAVQEGHLVAVHALCAALDARIAGAAPAVVDLDAAGTGPASRPRPRPHVVVVGDAVLDRDLHGRTDRVAPDAPVPVVDVDGVLESPGGAGLTALLCAGPDVRVTLVAPMARDAAGARLARALRERLDLVRLPHRGGTRTKTRVRSAGQSLARLDEGGPGDPAATAGADLDAVRAALESADVVLVSDYGAGTTRHPGVRELLAAAAARVPLVWDPHPRGGPPVEGSALVTPNLSEASAALAAARESGSDATDAGTPDAVAVALQGAWRARGVCVTAGSAGAYLALPGSEPMYVPAPAVEGGDPCGAGDRFAASAAVALARGAVLSEAVVAAVGDASAWVRAGGAAAFREQGGAVADPMGDGVPTPVDAAGEPPAAPGPAGASPLAEVEELIARVRARGGRVVATGGCFDVLHVGHIACLEAARRAGDALVVLVNSDASVRRLKGPSRLVVPDHERARVLRALGSVDAVVVFDEDDPRAVLDRLRPDVWAKGGDYGGAVLPEADLVRGWGGRVLLLPYVGGRSTTAILAQATTLQEVP